MKYIIIGTILLATTALAAKNTETLFFKNGVVFPHKAHQTYQKSDCKQCHRKGVQEGHIEGFEKDMAHRMCRTCHMMKQAGPTACKECHVRANK